MHQSEPVKYIRIGFFSAAARFFAASKSVPQAGRPSPVAPADAAAASFFFAEVFFLMAVFRLSTRSES